MPFDTQSGLRLREERERLRLTQQQMADEAGVRREMWSKYERGVAAPGAAAFKALARLGADQLYILTGQRVPPNPPIALLPDEQLLLEAYRALSAIEKRELLAALLSDKAALEGGEVKASKKQVVSGDGNRTAGRDYKENK